MKRLLFGFAVIAIMGVCLVFFLTRPKPEPLTYQGKPIEQWFAQLPVAVIPPPGNRFGNSRVIIKSYGQQYGSTNRSDRSSSLGAMEAFGTNALEFLLAKLQGRDSTGEQALTKAARGTGVRELPFRNADFERLQAVTALIQMKTLTPDARQLIVSLSTNTSTNVAAAAAYILTSRAEQNGVPLK